MVEKPNVLVVIPARFASTRLPGKPLINIGGKPMIVRVAQLAKKIKTADRVVIATDDERIKEVVEQAGYEAMMTSPDHQSGTDRIAEVARNINCDLVVNIQGDEPFLEPSSVDDAVMALVAAPDVSVSTLCVPVSHAEGAEVGVTCVVCDLNDRALYFSRLPVPFDRDNTDPDRNLLKHLGVYVYRRDFLLRFADMPQTSLERIEKLEQLRILENGEKILCVETQFNSIGIDSEDDVIRAELLFPGESL